MSAKDFDGEYIEVALSDDESDIELMEYIPLNKRHKGNNSKVTLRGIKKGGTPAPQTERLLVKQVVFWVFTI